MVNRDKTKEPMYTRAELIKKVILCILLLATLFFIVIQYRSFMKDVLYINTDEVDYISERDRQKLMKTPSEWKNDIIRYQARQLTDNRTSITGNVELRQEFTAQESRLGIIRIFFSNPSREDASGKVSVSLEDKNGKKVGSSVVGADIVANGMTSFYMAGDSEAINANYIISHATDNVDKYINIKEGEKYTLVLKSENVKAKDGLEVCLLTDKAEDENKLTKDGKELKGDHIFACVRYKTLNILVFSFFILAILAAMVFVLLPIQGIQRKLDAREAAKAQVPDGAAGKAIDINKILTNIMFFLTPFYSYFVICKITALKLSDTILAFASVRGVLNIFIIGTIWLILFTLIGRKRETIVLTTLAAFAFGFTNYVLLLFRDSPLIAGDLANIATAAGVVKSYNLSFDKASLWAIAFTMIWVCLALSLKGYNSLNWKKRAVLVLASALCCGAFNIVFFNSQVLENNHIKVSGFRPKSNYKKNGYPLSFIVTVGMSMVEKPSGYSAGAVANDMAKYESDPVVKATSTSSKSPNVIIIMNEAFSDLRVIKKFPTNKEFMPYFNSLSENTVKGTLHTSIFGGGTADTEFECLTGDTMQFLPFHSVPYNNRIKKGTPSVTRKYKAMGYSGILSFHPGMRDAYNRNNAYPNMGFDKFISMEDLKEPKLIRDYVSDEQDYEIIIDEYEKAKKKDPDTPFYMFNVTIQNHGGYLLSTGEVKSGINITDDDVNEEEASQYLNLMKQSDDALKGLLSYFEGKDEPTVVVFYGDHQPRVGNSFYEALYGKPSEQYEKILEEEELKYRVPFMIWANYKIKEEKDIHISANYISPYLSKLTGAPLTGYDKYLLELREKLPVITDICIMDSKGKLYDPDGENPYEDLLLGYQKMQYNGLIDVSNRNKDFFYLKD